MALNEDYQFEICSQCAGEGKRDKIICPLCSGDGLWLKIDGKNIFFDYDFSFSLLRLVQIKKALTFILKIFLIIFGLVGFLSFLQGVFYLEEVARFHAFFAQESKFLQLIFWFSILTDLFLIYLAQREKEGKNIFLTFKKSTKINVCNFLETSARKAIETASVFAKKLGHSQVEPIHLLIGVLQQKDGVRLLIFP